MNKPIKKYTIEEFSNIELDQVDPGNFVNKQSWDSLIIKMKEIKNLLDEMIHIIELNDEIPDSLKSRSRAYIATFTSYLNSITKEEEKKDGSQLAREKEQLIVRITGWCRELMEKTNNKSDELSFFETFSAIKNLDKSSGTIDFDEINRLREKSTADADSINRILREVQKKGSKETVSDYAEIFKRESDINRKASNIWLTIGICTSVIFITFLFLYNFNDKFPTQELIPGENTIVIYNIGNILTKILIYAIFIFIISFSFKQYSIRRHISTVNKHRQNGMDSFKIFIESINSEDVETRHTLMLQLAKSIYEQTSSGYIGDKNSNVNSGIVEITKMIRGNNES
ncbi:hypothetical protein LCM02_12340 [Lutimonas saemankumensis]|uniref:hypothetical protein n=1 Tax=Lutimonas saemankumensis TaxID=483016 RepID=UPI001CD27C8B|nr:hypothetical protein [Lutimonas saemankumensis]MCA0933243.1 hypothetical protein [Lutimonas saemankumensis]